MINNKAIRWTMGASFDSLANYRGAEILDSAPHSRHIYIDRGSSILGVAHIDSVQKYHGTRIGNDKIHASTVDDRIGVYMMLFGLPYMGIYPDVLLTDNEEIGQSTAQFFEPVKEYNWMFQFDRGGTDAVCYQYETDIMRGSLQECGITVNPGIFSDISVMDHLGCCGFNMGCGMHDYHSKGAYVEINELMMMSTLFRYFWTFYHDTYFEFDPATMWADPVWGDSDLRWDDDMPMYVNEDLEHIICDYCGVWDYRDNMALHVDAMLCPGCHDWFTNGMIESTGVVEHEN